MAEGADYDRMQWLDGHDPAQFGAQYDREERVHWITKGRVTYHTDIRAAIDAARGAK